MDNDEYNVKRISSQLIKLAKDSVVYGVTNVTSLFVGLFLMPLYTRIFSSSEYGVIEIITTSTTALMLIAGMQVDSGVARYYYEYEDGAERRKLISTGFLLKLAAPLVICLSVLPWTGQISSSWLGSSIYQRALFISFLIMPLQNLLNYICLIFRLQRSKKKFIILAAGNTVSMMLLCIYFIAYLRIGIEGVFLGYFLAYLIFTILGFLLLRKSFALNFSFAFARVILTFSIPSIPSVLGNWLGKYMDRFLLMPLVGLAGVGLYSAGAKIASAILLVISAFQLAWTPYSMYLINKENHKTIYSKVLTYYVALLSSAAIIIVIFSREILHLIAPTQYWEAHTFIGFLVIGYVLNGAFTVAGIGLNIVKKTYLLTIAYLIGLASGVVCLLLLTPRIGVMGAAIASLVSSVVAFAVVFYIAQRNYSISYELRRVFAICLVVLCSVPVTLAIDRNLSGIANIGVKIAELMVFSLCIFGILPKIEVSVILNVVRQQCKGLVLALNSRVHFWGR